jgi:hypothetical protein
VPSFGPIWLFNGNARQGDGNWMKDKSERAERLGAALRANLRRRKQTAGPDRILPGDETADTLRRRADPLSPSSPERERERDKADD